MALKRSYQTKFLESLTEMSGCFGTSTNQRKMLRPKEIEKSNLMVDEAVEVLEETYLNPFSDDLDKNQLYNIVSSKTVSTGIKDSLITINEKGQEMILEYMQRINKDNSIDSIVMPQFVIITLIYNACPNL